MKIMFFLEKYGTKMNFKDIAIIYKDTMISCGEQDVSKIMGHSLRIGSATYFVLNLGVIVETVS
jgi:hypothetical protein